MTSCVSHPKCSAFSFRSFSSLAKWCQNPDVPFCPHPPCPSPDRLCGFPAQEHPTRCHHQPQALRHTHIVHASYRNPCALVPHANHACLHTASTQFPVEGPQALTIKFLGNKNTTYCLSRKRCSK